MENGKGNCEVGHDFCLGFRVGLIKNVTFEQVPEAEEGLSVWINWGKSL